MFIFFQGSPAPHQTHEPSMPILETSTTTRKIRESLDSHEDELLEDLATYGEELDKGVDESVVNLANDLIGKIEEQEFSDDDMEDNNSNYKVNKTSSASNKSDDQDNRSTKSDEDLDLDLHLSEDDEITENIMNEALPDVALPDIPETQIVTIADDLSDASSSSSSAEEEVEFKCEICASEFATATSLKIHRLKCVKSQQQKKQNKIEIFSCEFCMDEFRSETSLKMHKLICTKKKSDKAQDDPTGDKSGNFPIYRKNDPIREFFEKEEKMKKAEHEKVPTKEVQAPVPPKPVVPVLDPLPQQALLSPNIKRVQELKTLSSPSSGSGSSSESELSKSPKKLEIKEKEVSQKNKAMPEPICE